MAAQLSNLYLNYLLEIYYAEIIETNNDSRSISSAELAQRMITTQSSVNRVIDKLNNENLIHYERYVGVRLNERGIQQAESILRRQGIIECFLLEQMNVNWDQVNHEAKLLRNSVSDNVLNRMGELVHHPKRSPFGEWLVGRPPSAPKEIFLNHADTETPYTIERVLTRQMDRLQYLHALGLVPQVSLQVMHKAPFDGPMQIRLGQEYRILGHELSKMLSVSKKVE